MNEIQQIERYLEDKLSANERIAFEGKMISDVQTRINVFFQRKLIRLLHLYHSEKLKVKLMDYHTELFNNPSKKEFHKCISKLFQE